MDTPFLIRMRADGALEWRSPQGRSGVGAPPPAELAAAPHIVVLVPSEAVLLTHVVLPRTTAAKRARVLPFALEDQLLDAVDTLHFALGAEHGAAGHAVAVVARKDLERWLAELAAAGITADRMLPDALAVPVDAAGAAVVIEAGRALVRGGADEGFACAEDELAGWLGGSVVASSSSIGAADALALFAHGLADGSSINLLSGDHAPRHRRAPQRLMWRMAATCALGAIAIAFATRGIEVARLARANDVAEAEIAAIHARAFPGTPEVPDPVARMRSELARAGGAQASRGLMPLLARVAPILMSQDSRLRVLGLEFRGDTLELGVRAPDLAVLDQLRERLATLPALNAELVAATPGEGGVDGRVRVRGAAP